MYKDLDAHIRDASLRSQQSLAESKARASVRALPWISVEQALPQNDFGKRLKARCQYLVKLAPHGKLTVARFGHDDQDYWVDTFGHLLTPEYGNKVDGWCPLPSGLGDKVMNNLPQTMPSK